MAKKTTTAAPVPAPVRWRVASRSRRPVVHRGDIQVCFVADGLEADGETPNPNALGAIVTLGFEHPELAATRPAAVLSELEKTLEWQLWRDAKADIDEITESIAELEKSIQSLTEGEQTRDAWHNRRELLLEVQYEQKRLAEAIGPAQEAYDCAHARAKAILDSEAQAAYETLLEQRRAILAELANVCDPFLDRLAFNQDALSRRDHGSVPNIGPRPEVPKESVSPAEAASRMGMTSSALVRA